MSRIRSSLTYANVMATIAVFIALGGGAYAAFSLPNNSVGSRHIKANAVDSSKVRNGSLLRRDFKAGQLPVGAVGPQGQQGPQGPKGDPGPPLGVRYVDGAIVSVPVGERAFAFASCPGASDMVTGGGLAPGTMSQDFDMLEEWVIDGDADPDYATDTYVVLARNNSDTAYDLQVRAVCTK